MLIDKLKQDKIRAMKEKNEIQKSILNLAISNSLAVAKDSKPPRETPTDEECSSQIEKLIKNNRDAIEIIVNTSSFEPNLKQVEILSAEVGFLTPYLPEKMDNDQLKKVIEKYVSEKDIQGMKSMGEVMSYLKKDFPKKYDRKTASKIVKELLG